MAKKHYILVDHDDRQVGPTYAYVTQAARAAVEYPMGAIHNCLAVAGGKRRVLNPEEFRCYVVTGTEAGKARRRAGGGAAVKRTAVPDRASKVCATFAAPSKRSRCRTCGRRWGEHIFSPAVDRR